MIGLHRIANYMDRGIDPSLVAMATAFDAVLAGLVTVGVGWAGNRIPSQGLGAAWCGCLALSCGLTIFADEPIAMFIAIGLFGSGIGIVMYLQNLIWAGFFGRIHLRSIRGFTMPISLLIGAAGVPFAGYVKDVSGSYAPVWWGAPR
jgi:hypothetical protein